MRVREHTLELFQHTLQTHWGLATPVSVRGAHARYQFEDGQVREFRRESPLLRRVRATPRHAEAVELLEKHLTSLEHVREQRRRHLEVAREAPHEIGRQVEVMKAKFPLGFGGTRWKVQVRGHGNGRRLKRHRDPAVLGARQRLVGPLLEQLLVKERHDEIHRLAMETLASTNLVHASQRRPLEQMSASEMRRFAIRLTEVLHDNEEPFDARFDRWVQACNVYLKRPPAWEAVTAPLALWSPSEHVCVRPEPLVLQAQRLGVELSLPDFPTSAAYREAVGVVRGVRDACVDHGLRPRDLLDVCDFIELTTEEPPP